MYFRSRARKPTRPCQCAPALCVGLPVDELVWDHSTFSKNRDRLLEADIARELFEAIVEQPRVAGNRAA